MTRSVADTTGASPVSANKQPDNSEQPPATDDPTAIILYGGTGDLAKRMVLPAIYELYTRGMLPTQFRLIGNGRRTLTDEDFVSHIHDALTEFATTPDDSEFAEFAKLVAFAGGGFRSDDPGTLLDVIKRAEDELHAKVHLVHYMAIPPKAFAATTTAVKAHGLQHDAKAVYEKPYGESLQGFHELNDLVHSVFAEEQVYRIDHFLGKEATQNLHLTRFANRLFGDAWSKNSIAQVQVDVPETLDVADRADFYDATGAMLDMLVTHLFQVAAEVAMEPPASMKDEDVQNARESVIAAFRPLDPGEVVLGQYQSYTATEGVPNDSTTETFVAARLWVDTDRWQGVPFLLRTGKKLAQSAQRVSLVLKPMAGPLGSVPANANAIVFDLLGNGAIGVQLTVKKPGPDPVPAESATSLKLQDVAPGAMAPYTSLIHDVLSGNRLLFTSSAGLQSAFETFQPMLTGDRPEPHGYADDSWGPRAAEELTGDVGWLTEQKTSPPLS